MQREPGGERTRESKRVYGVVNGRGSIKGWTAGGVALRGESIERKEDGNRLPKSNPKIMRESEIHSRERK